MLLNSAICSYYNLLSQYVINSYHVVVLFLLTKIVFCVFLHLRAERFYFQ